MLPGLCPLLDHCILLCVCIVIQCSRICFVLSGQTQDQCCSCPAPAARRATHPSLRRGPGLATRLKGTFGTLPCKSVRFAPSLRSCSSLSLLLSARWSRSHSLACSLSLSLSLHVFVYIYMYIINRHTNM